ncbi:MAG: hypothetical protein IJJ33_02585, partial [Victivallales bacterium]|nr:hypothetical protein [Victivallales bacterium]
MKASEIPFKYLSKLDGRPERDSVRLGEVQRAAEVIYNTSCLKPTKERMLALNVMKAACDRIAPDAYKRFYTRREDIPATELEEIYRVCPALWWHDDAFRKILYEMLYTPVTDGHPVLWHVYNMGYVIKTSTVIFTIDLHHRLATQLVQYILFAGITHNHDDHYTIPFAEAVNKARKPLLTNFFPNSCYMNEDGQSGYSKEAQRTMKIGDVIVKTFESDHNRTLRRFVQPIEIHCGTGKNRRVILTSGDTCDPRQLAVCAKRPDCYIVHPYVGLDVGEAVRILQPQMTLISHLQEFHHPIHAARWTWRQGYDAAQK